jgi:hypothetical protein
MSARSRILAVLAVVGIFACEMTDDPALIIGTFLVAALATLAFCVSLGLDR